MSDQLFEIVMHTVWIHPWKKAIPVVKITSGHRSISECVFLNWPRTIPCGQFAWPITCAGLCNSSIHNRNTGRKTRPLFQCSLFVSSVVSVSLIEWYAFQIASVQQSSTMKRGAVQDGGSDTKRRQVTYTTLQKWQRELDREYQTMSWLDWAQVHYLITGFDYVTTSLDGFIAVIV